MTSKQISEEYNIPVSLLEKMKADSKCGSFYRQYKQEVSYNRCIKIVVRNGGKFEVSFFPMPKFCLRVEKKGTGITQEKINGIISDLAKNNKIK